jgi:hypothetical protein
MSDKKKLKGVKEKDVRWLEWTNIWLFERYILVLKSGKKIRVSRKFGKVYRQLGWIKEKDNE